MEYAELQQLVKQYQPHPDTLERLKNVKLLMVVGPSGVGKTTLVRASGLPEVVGDASRPARPSEHNGIDYWFRPEADMLAEARAGRYLQIAVGSEGDIKATHAGSFPDKGWAVFAVTASAVPIFRQLPFRKTITAIIVPPSYDDWMSRLDQHHLSLEKVALRLQEAKRSYDFALTDQDSLFVLNDNIALAADRLSRLTRGEVPSRHNDAQAMARKLWSQMGGL